MQPTLQAHISQQEAKAVEAQAIDTLLENSHPFQVALNLKALKTPKLLSLVSKIIPGLKSKRCGLHIPKDWDIEIKSHTDNKTGQTRQTYLRTLHLSPLYLGTIDRIRRLSLQINYDEKAIKEDPIGGSRRLFTNIDTMTEIAALATLNTPPTKTRSYKKALRELKHFYKEHMTSVSLLELIGLINIMSDPVDFLGSIRLVQMSGTTGPKANQVE